MSESVGYVRVSTREQNAALQETAMRDAGVSKTFSDLGVSGTKTSRPELDRLLDYVREGDTLVVWRLDRLGRNSRHVLEVIDLLTERGVGFRSLTEGLDTTGPMGRAMLTILAAFAQLERDTMIERTRAGLAAAREQGRTGGRPRSVDAVKLERIRKLISSGDHTRAEVAAMVGISRATLFRTLEAL
jgi:DNA invertase Pin-like site-specific DNA recombinase